MDIIDWVPDKTKKVPLYKQLTDYIKMNISSGDWPIGTKIPSQRTMSEMFQINRSTVNTALNELVADGLLETCIGSGTKVADNSWSILASSSSMWSPYTQRGLQQPNLTTVQKINTYEFAHNIIRLGTGELSPDFYPKELMRTTLYDISEQINNLGYAEPKGLYQLREELCRYLIRLGIKTTPASILIVSGALQALQLISLGLLNQASTMYVERPSYLFSLNLFQSAGIQLRGVPMDQEGISLESLRCAKKLSSRCLYTIPCFQNPTGITMSESRRADLFTLCANERLPIIEDDVYRELWIDSPPPNPIKSLDTQGLVLYIGSFSKALSPGLRIGWIVGPEPVINRLADIKNQVDYGSSSLSQWAVHKILASGSFYDHLDNTRLKLQQRRELCRQALQHSFSGIATWEIQKGGFYVWLKLIKPVPMDKLFYVALENGLLINPGNIYDKRTNQYIRLSFAYASETDLVEGIDKLSKLVKQAL